MEDEKKQNTVRGSIYKLMGVVVFALVCIYVGRIYMKDSKTETPTAEVSQEESMRVFDIKMSVLDITQEKGSLFTEIRTAGLPELVSNRPGTRVALDTVEKAIEFIKKVTPENMTFILATNQGTAILKCTEISQGSTPESIKFKFHQDEGNLQGILDAYDAHSTSKEISPSKEASGVLLALSYAGFKKEDQNKEVPVPFLDRVNYLLVPEGVIMNKGEKSTRQNPAFPWRTAFLGVHKVTVVSIQGKEAEMGAEEFATKVWKDGPNNFETTPPNGNFKAHDSEGNSYFFALKFANPSFKTPETDFNGAIEATPASDVLTFETEFLEDDQGQKAIPPVLLQEGGTFESRDKTGVVVVIDDHDLRLNSI